MHYCGHTTLGQSEVIRLILEMPANGYGVFNDLGALQLHFPNRGWVDDDGLTVIYKCRIPRGNTRQQAQVFNYSYICEMDRGLRVYFHLRNMFVKDPPDSLRWVPTKGYYREEPSYGLDRDADVAHDEAGAGR